MFVENGCNRIFPENLVKYYNAKKKKIKVVITTKQRKFHWYLNWTKN